MTQPKWLCKTLNDNGFSQIEEAVKAAEKKTSCEIVPMIVRRSSAIGHVQLILFCLFLIVFLLADGHHFLHLAPLYQILTFAGVVFVLAFSAKFLATIPFLQRRLTSDEDLKKQVEMRAEVEFYEAGLTRTKSKTGILIFVSLMEHKIVVLADQAIADKLPQETWSNVVKIILMEIKNKNLAKGFSDAIAHCGELVSPLFPRKTDDTDELTNHLIVKE